MRFEFAEQYRIVCAVIEPGDTAKDIINAAAQNSLIYFDGEDICYCVRFPDRPQELYTEEALHRSKFPAIVGEYELTAALPYDTDLGITFELQAGEHCRYFAHSDTYLFEARQGVVPFFSRITVEDAPNVFRPVDEVGQKEKG